MSGEYEIHRLLNRNADRRRTTRAVTRLPSMNIEGNTLLINRKTVRKSVDSKLGPTRRTTRSVTNYVGARKTLFVMGSKSKKYSYERVKLLKQVFDEAVANTDVELVSALQLACSKHAALTETQSILSFPHISLTSFKEFLKLVCPNASLSQLNVMLVWVNCDEDCFEQPLPARKQTLPRLSHEVLQDYRRLFNRLDLNQDGVLSLEELTTKFNKVVSVSNIETLMTQFSTGKQGIGFKDFLRLVMPHANEYDIEAID